MSTEKSKLPFAQRRENIGLPDHVYRQVAELERELAAANLARERVEQLGKLLEDQLRRTQGYEASGGPMGFRKIPRNYGGGNA